MPHEQPGGWKRRLRRELLEYWMTVLYLSLYFGAFTWYRRLILAQYQISYMNYGVAVVEALVLAKVVFIGEALWSGRGLESRPLIVPTLVRAALFTVWVWIFNIGEEAVKGWWRGEGLAGGFHEFIGQGKYQLLASSLVVFFTFIPFFAFRELNRVMGRGHIWRLFFQRPAAPNASPGGDFHKA